MAVELLLDDAPGPAPLALAVEQGLVTLPVPLRVLPQVTAATARQHPDALVLLPVVEYALLQQTHIVLPHLAAGGRHGAAAVLRADRRLDEIDGPVVDLAAISRTTECLVRATLIKFYGITPGVWARDGEAAEAPATHALRASAEPAANGEQPDAALPSHQPLLEVREGGEALHLLDQPGDAVVEDLGRAWFIMTGLPYTSHLLVASPAVLATEPQAQALLDALPGALATVHERRRELRRDLSQRYGVSRELLNDFYSDQFSTLTGDAQKGVVALFARGAWGLNLPTVTRLALPPGTPNV